MLDRCALRSIETWEVPFESYHGGDAYIFVSYAHEIVFADLSFLHAQGYRIWYDEGIDPGNEWTDDIADALSNCAFFLVFISDHAVASKNVKDEIKFALKHEKRFLAVHIKDTPLQC